MILSRYHLGCQRKMARIPFWYGMGLPKYLLWPSREILGVEGRFQCSKVLAQESDCLLLPPMCTSLQPLCLMDLPYTYIHIHLHRYIVTCIYINTHVNL